jgi:hypothetical protein
MFCSKTNLPNNPAKGFLMPNRAVLHQNNSAVLQEESF